MGVETCCTETPSGRAVAIFTERRQVALRPDLSSWASRATIVGSARLKMSSLKFSIVVLGRFAPDFAAHAPRQTVDLRCQMAGQRGVAARKLSTPTSFPQDGVDSAWHLPCWIGAFMSSTQAMPASERCHPAAVEFLLFLPRDRAVVMRRHIMTDPQFRDVSVSRLYRVGS